MRYVTRTSALEYEDFNSAKSRLIERAEKFGEISCKVGILAFFLALLAVTFLLWHLGVTFGQTFTLMKMWKHIAGTQDNCHG